MQVARIEVFGFKSFMDRVILPFDKGITGVVGPNGCGKSNIVDALRWVLGETRASQLRGGVLEDVIFNGTDKLRPLGLAEVTLTLKNSSEFEDILTEISRTEVSSAEALNNFKIDELTAIPVAVQQPAVTVELKVLPGGEQASLVESIEIINGENASVSTAEVDNDASAQDKKNSEQRPAEQDPTQESSGMVDPFSRRFGWMKGLKEIQITRRFYRSGESEYFINRVPCRLKDLKDLFRACGLGARTYTIVAQGEIARVVNAKPEDRRLIVEEAAGIMGFRERMNEANRRLAETKNNLQRILDVEKELTRQVNSLKRQAQRAIARKEQKEELFKIDEQLFGSQIISLSEKLTVSSDELDKMIKQEAEIEASLNSAKVVEEGMRGDLYQYESNIKDARSGIDRLRDELHEITQNRLRQASKIQEMKAFKSARISETERLEERIQTLNSRKTATEDELKQLDVQDKEIAEKMQATDNGEAELRSITQELNVAREELRAKDLEIREVREKMSSIAGSLNAIGDQLIAASPLNQLKKSFSSEFAQKILPGVKAFIDGIHVEERYSKALQSLLAEKAGFLIAENPHSVAEEFLRVYGNKTESGKKGEGLGILKSGDSQSEIKIIEIEGALPVLRVVKVEPGFGISANAVLKDCYFADNFESVAAIIEKAASHQQEIIERAVFVTLRGEIVTKNSFYALYHEGGLLQLRSRQQNLQASHNELKARSDSLAAERENISVHLKDREKRHGEVLREIQERQAQQRELGRQQGSIRGRIYAGKNTITQISTDLERTQSMIVESKKRIQEIETQLLELEETIRNTEINPEEQLKSEICNQSSLLEKLENEQKSKRDQLQEKTRNSAVIRTDLDNNRTRKTQLEVLIEKLKLEADNLKRRTVNDYGSDILDQWMQAVSQLVEGSDQERLPQIAAEESAAMEERAREIRTRISKEGEVDSTSIERLEEENARLEPLKIQREDLEKATATLEKSIEELRATSAERFVATFERVRNSFSMLAPRLYGGGQADLELTDPANPLDSGMNLLVRPPGKKPKNIDMLSGGEKALCATALIFSLFLERPSPICVLDEVDAPLDDANLLRFLSLIQEMSQRTQFLMITHNKQSMTVAGNLVGVTMQQPGVTKFISVSLEEAMQQAA